MKVGKKICCNNRFRYWYSSWKDWYTLYQFTGKTDQILVFISNQKLVLLF
jgi:hypothetical protein